MWNFISRFNNLLQSLTHATATAMSVCTSMQTKAIPSPVNYLLQHPRPTFVKALGVAAIATTISFAGISSAQAATETENQLIASCNQGNVQSCNVLAQTYLTQKQYVQAANYLTKVCYSKSPDAINTCAALMTMLIDPTYGVNDFIQGIKIGDYLCHNNNSYGCLLLSTIYFEGNRVPQDLQKASTYAKRACELKDATGCRQYAMITFTAAYILKDINLAEESYKYHRYACELGNKDSCTELQQYPTKIEEFRLYAQSPNAPR